MNLRPSLLKWETNGRLKEETSAIWNVKVNEQKTTNVVTGLNYQPLLIGLLPSQFK
jgi:hypothetical protein